MTFIEAVIWLDKLGFSICGNPDEAIGERDVCVHHSEVTDPATDGTERVAKESDFIGKLRWPRSNHPAFVDDSVVEAIKDRLTVLAGNL